VKEVLPVAARALGLTIQPWEVRGTDDFDGVFAAMGKQRPDGLYVSGSPLMNNNQKRIAGFALKSRLPSIYARRAAVEAGGLMSYAADSRTATGASHITWTESEGNEACRSAGRAADEIRAGD
jgi:ABC-type uncharacterized transport system substrate-binding protein